ncbi:MAG: 3D domain-containing protein [Phycisphaeraceae bacterium]
MRRQPSRAIGARAVYASVALAVAITMTAAGALTVVAATSTPPATSASPTAPADFARAVLDDTPAASMPDAAVPVVATADDGEEVVTFDGRRLRPVRTIDMRVTAYSPGPESCGEFADGITASGYSVWTNAMRLVAADTDLLPFGTIVSVPGYHDGEPVQVLDRGGAIKGNRLDVLYPTHERALQWGVQHVEVVVYEYAD